MEGHVSETCRSTSSWEYVAQHVVQHIPMCMAGLRVQHQDSGHSAKTMGIALGVWACLRTACSLGQQVPNQNCCHKLLGKLSGGEESCHEALTDGDCAQMSLAPYCCGIDIFSLTQVIRWAGLGLTTGHPGSQQPLI